MTLRRPTSPAERDQFAKAYASTDPFAIARWEKPGCKYIKVVDVRDRGTDHTFVIAVPPSSEWFELLKDDQFCVIDNASRQDHVQLTDSERRAA